MLGFDGNCHKQHTQTPIILYTFLQVAGGNRKGDGNLFLFVLFDVPSSQLFIFFCIIDGKFDIFQVYWGVVFKHFF